MDVPKPNFQKINIVSGNIQEIFNLPQTKSFIHNHGYPVFTGTAFATR